jgi:hypothetical protein
MNCLGGCSKPAGAVAKIDAALRPAAFHQSPLFIPTIHTMSTSDSAPVSFYKSDLEVMTAFVMDRSKFLDTVVDAITSEGKNDAATKMVSLLENGAFLQFMPVLLSDKTAELRSKALLALGNLICSDNPAVASAAFKIAEREFNTIEACARDPETMEGGAYVVFTLAFRINSLLGGKQSPLIGHLLSVAKDLVGEHRTCVARDMLYVIKMFGTCTDVHMNDLLYLMESSNKLTRRTALSLLADQVSRDDFDAEHCDVVYDTLSHFYFDMKSHNAHTRHEVAWTLSNLVTETGMADKFFDDADLFDAVVDAMLLDSDCSAAAENAWVITNAVAKCDIGRRKGNFLQRLRAELNNYKNSRYIMNQRTKTAVSEALVAIENAIKKHADAAARVKELMNAFKEPLLSLPTQPCVATPTLSTISMEVDEDTAWLFDNSPVPNLWNLPTARPELYNVPCERPDLYLPPTAYELLAKGFARKETSKVVYDLIRSVEANGNTYTPISKDMVLTVDDLTTLEDLGFTIVRGCIGISAAIVSRFYAN